MRYPAPQSNCTSSAANTRHTKKRYIEGDITASERPRWEANFEAVPEALTGEEKDAFLKELTGVSLSSDAFFPFRDSIDHASKVGTGGAVILSTSGGLRLFVFYLGVAGDKFRFYCCCWYLLKCHSFFMARAAAVVGN